SQASIQSISPWMAGRRAVFRCWSNICRPSSKGKMSFSDLQGEQDPVQLLQRSLERGRLGHAYLFSGSDLMELEKIARTLAKTVNCQSPPGRNAAGLPLDSCDHCESCRKIDAANHPDISWIRP